MIYIQNTINERAEKKGGKNVLSCVRKPRDFKEHQLSVGTKITYLPDTFKFSYK